MEDMRNLQSPSADSVIGAIFAITLPKKSVAIYTIEISHCATFTITITATVTGSRWRVQGGMDVPVQAQLQLSFLVYFPISVRPHWYQVTIMNPGVGDKARTWQHCTSPEVNPLSPFHPLHQPLLGVLLSLNPSRWSVFVLLISHVLECRCNTCYQDQSGVDVQPEQPIDGLRIEKRQYPPPSFLRNGQTRRLVWIRKPVSQVVRIDSTMHRRHRGLVGVSLRFETHHWLT